MFSVLLKSQFFLGIASYPTFLKQLLNNKMPGSSTAADSPFASFIRPKHQTRPVLPISLYLCNNAATIYFHHHSQYTYSVYVPSDCRFSFCLAIFLKLTIISLREPPFLLGRVELPNKFSKSESSVGFQFLEGVTVQEGVTLFVGWQFLHKLKSEIVNEKRYFYNQRYFFL